MDRENWNEGDPIECTCGDCGKKFDKGDEGDNEEFCLRCEALSMIEIDSE
jgi:hypothetical protein